MANSHILRSKTAHLFLSIFILTVAIYTQSCFLAKSSFNFMHFDLVSIVVVYICIEYFLLISVVLILYAALLLQVSSAAPAGFFVMYFLIVLVFSNLLSRFFVMSSFLGQIFIFSILFSIKYFLFYFSIPNRGISALLNLVLNSWQGYIITIFLALPIFKILFFIDSYFDFIPSLDKKRINEF